jgi:hypothetical protein
MSMRPPLHRVLPALIVGIAVAAARSEDVTLGIQETWSGFFGGSTQTLHVLAEPSGAGIKRFGWSLAVDGRVVGRGETPADGGSAAIPVNIPAIKEGVVLPAIVSVEALEPVLSAAEKPVWIFAENAFSGKMEWLKSLHILLFDPDGATAAILEKTDIPFTAVRNPEALVSAAGRLVIVGEGISLEEYPALAETLVRAALAGRAVLCLAPADGSLPIPGAFDLQNPRPIRMRFARSDVIKEIDKRLDAEAWPVDGRVVARDLALRSERQQVVGQFLPAGSGWPWFEAEFPGGGRLLFCGFAMIEKWDQGPAPRYLLVRLIENLFPNREEKEMEP